MRVTGHLQHDQVTEFRHQILEIPRCQDDGVTSARWMVAQQQDLQSSRIVTYLVFTRVVRSVKPSPRSLSRVPTLSS